MLGNDKSDMLFFWTSDLHDNKAVDSWLGSSIVFCSSRTGPIAKSCWTRLSTSVRCVAMSDVAGSDVLASLQSPLVLDVRDEEEVTQGRLLLKAG